VVGIQLELDTSLESEQGRGFQDDGGRLHVALTRRRPPAWLDITGMGSA